MVQPLSDEQLRPFLAKAGMRKAGSILAVICAGIAPLGFIDPSASMPVKLGLAIPFGLLAIVFLYVGLRPANKHAFIVALRAHHDQLVWIYVTQQTVNNRHANTYLSVGFANGHSATMAIGKAPKQDLIAKLQGIAPQATVGFTADLQAQFKRDPSSLATPPHQV